MTRRLKNLGVALVAVFALAAAMASAASAASFTSSTYPTTATGTSAAGNTVFTTEGGTVECALHYVGTLNAASSDLTVTPAASNCKSFGFLNAEITGCKYTFTAVSTTKATVDIVNPCTIKSGTCHVTVANQGPLSHVGITNLGSGDVSVNATLTGINYTVVTDGFLCPYGGTGNKVGATYTNKVAITFDAVSPASASISVS